MQKLLMLFTIMVMSFSVGVIDVDAKRLGGGRSFGMQRSFQAPSRPATPPASAPAMAPHAPNRGFGWGGALAGLAAGGLLGALLFGGGFSGLRPLDIIVLLGLAVIVFLAVRAMRRKREEVQPMGYTGLGNQEQPVPPYSGYGQSVMDEPAYAPAAAGGSVRPAGFDEEEFLHSAKAAFIRLQAAWDAKDLNDIRRFTTPEIFGELSTQIQESGDTVNRTEVLNVDAVLLDVAQETDQLVASVRYDARMREDANADVQSISEVWHFVKPVNSTNPTWYLAGIQQH